MSAVPTCTSRGIVFFSKLISINKTTSWRVFRGGTCGFTITLSKHLYTTTWWLSCVSLPKAYRHAESMCAERESVFREEQHELARVFTKRGRSYSSFLLQERNICVLFALETCNFGWPRLDLQWRSSCKTSNQWSDRSINQSIDLFSCLWTSINQSMIKSTYSFDAMKKLGDRCIVHPPTTWSEKGKIYPFLASAHQRISQSTHAPDESLLVKITKSTIS